MRKIRGNTERKVERGQIKVNTKIKGKSEEK
jgi:hypothetical protein